MRKSAAPPPAPAIDRPSHWVGDAVVVVACGLYGTLMGVHFALDQGAGYAVSAWTIYLLYAVVGGLVLRQRSRNPIGISVAVMGVVPLLGNLAETIAANDALGGALGTVASWVRVWYFFVFFGAFVPLFHVFPTGKPLPGLWRWWYRAALLGSGALVIGSMFGPSDDPGYVNPFELRFLVVSRPVVMALLFATLFAGLVTAVASLAVRFRRARAQEREQLKWFFLSAIAAMVVFFLFPILAHLVGWPPVDVAESLSALGFALPAMGILIAVTRYRLFDIDRVVSRTFTYAAIALVIGAVYVVPVVVLPEVLGLSSDLAVALATLVAAALFSPLRRRVQAFVARRFDRERYDAARVLDGVAARLQEIRDAHAVSVEVGSAVAAALRPRAVAVWLREPGS